MRITLLFGFLGSGKTTLARRILQSRPAGSRMAVIVNEFGDVGIDGAILSGQNVDMVELTSGCLCCTLKGPLLKAVEELAEKADHIVIEATGIAEPEEMVETFADPTLRARFEIGPLVTVVDAANFEKLREMLGEFYLAQVQNADVLVLNKIDRASHASLEALRDEVMLLNPDASIYFTEQSDIEVADLLTGPPSRLVAERAEDAHPGAEGHAPHDDHHDHGHDHHGHGHEGARHAPAQSFVLEASSGASRAAVQDFFATLPANVWRAKGFMPVDGAPSLLQYSVSGLDITAAAPRDSYRLVFIGPDLDRPLIERRFAALVRGGSA